MQIDLCRARELQPFDDDDLDDVTLTNLLDAACSAVVSFLNYDPTLTTYDELYQGVNSRSLFLRARPVVSVSAVRYGQQVALQVYNGTQNVQAATLAITETSLILTLTNDGSSTVVTLNYAAYPTLGQMNTAINALGNGWTSTIASNFSSWASADLAAYAGQTLGCRQFTAFLAPHYYYLNDYKINARTGELVMGVGWFGGYQSFRIQYTAGYSQLPDDLVQATVEVAAQTYQNAATDPNLQSESLGQYSWTRATQNSFKTLSPLAYATLKRYRIPATSYFRV